MPMASNNATMMTKAVLVPCHPKNTGDQAVLSASWAINPAIALERAADRSCSQSLQKLTAMRM